jgi:hypothetical protein
MDTPSESRRSFLKKTATASAAVAVSAAGLRPALGSSPKEAVVIVSADDSLTRTAPVQWAIEEFTKALASRGMAARIVSAFDEGGAEGERILVSGAGSSEARQVLAAAGVAVPASPEALALVRGKIAGRKVLLASGSDARGASYALLELADRARFAPEPLAGLKKITQVVQQPANRIRGITRLFTSKVEDQPWYYDREFWQGYLTLLATHRFNRLHLGLGLGYDFTTDITDCYFHFAYPFLVSPQGHSVRAVPLPEEERNRNLEMLRFISDETARRGLQFQLGVWTHAYEWTHSPDANYRIEGLDAQNHAAYCRDALEAILRACPSIGGVTLRTHGESGVAEGSYDFWRTVYDGAVRCGRPIELDLHTKGIDARLIELAAGTGLPVTISPKYWAEHAGPGYMQGAIRPQEMPPQDAAQRGFFSLSSGSRSFMRYGYGDLFAENRRYAVLHRLWPGTQRLLLWADPELAADYGRASGFCGSAGMEWMEPLAFKGRKGSGLPGGRDAYADASLRPAGGDFEKYAYSYRVWGRHLYDPDCDADEWQRELKREFGRAAGPVEGALSEAGRILPLFTVAHCPSAANNLFWPEMYWNMPIVDARRRHPYSDTPSPKRFGAVSPLDPEFFSRIDDFADALIKGEPHAKHSPAWVAAEMESHAARARAWLATATARARDARDPAFRRISADVAILCGLGDFFAWKLRSGVLFAIYERTGHESALEEALSAYRRAREAWQQIASGPCDVYRADVTFGPDYYQRGHWRDRIESMDADIADMEKLRKPADASVVPEATTGATTARAIKAVLNERAGWPRPMPRNFHSPPKSFRRGEPLEITASPGTSASLILRYRHVNQSELWQRLEMGRQDSQSQYGATIPAEYTNSVFPLQYHFEVREPSGAAWFYPGLKPGWMGQPYFVVRSADA